MNPPSILSRVSKSTREANPQIFGDNPEPPGLTTQVPNIKPLRGSKQPNKTEAAFRNYIEHLSRGASQLEFEPVKLRIGPNCYYAPDWGNLSNKPPTFYEVKGGHIWDDSLVKFKAAKERHTWAEFEMWQLQGGIWTRLL